MDIYSNNSSISFISPELMNFFRYMAKRGKEIPASHCSIIDIDPLIDKERIGFICHNVVSIECVRDQLPFVKEAKVLIVHSDGELNELEIDNKTTKLIIVIGNVLNVKLSIDDEETIVFHRTFNYNNETGIVVGDKYDDTKPTYHLFKNNNPFPDIFEKDVVKESGIVFATEKNRQSLLSGNGLVYIIDTQMSLNTFREAGIVAVKNNSVFQAEITRNITIIHGKPTKFKSVNEIETKNQGDIIMTDMSIDDLRSFLEHPHIRSYEPNTTNQSTEIGYSIADDYSKGISPARHILSSIIKDEEMLDEYSFKIDNPFTFAFVKIRNPSTYNLFIYNVISKHGQSTNDNSLISQKLAILLPSRRERNLDLARKNRYEELQQLTSPPQGFMKEYPSMSAYADKRNTIREGEEERNKTISDFTQQKKSFKITEDGNHLFENIFYLDILVSSYCEIYVRNCGLVFIRTEDTTSFSCHIIGNIHTIMVPRNCIIKCYFVGKELGNGLYCDETETDDVGMFFDDFDENLFTNEYKLSDTFLRDLAITSQSITALPNPRNTKIKNLFTKSKVSIVNRSLACIDKIIVI